MSPACFHRLRLCLGLLGGVLLLPHAAAGECIAEEPASYRESEFRAPVPCTLRGGTVLDTAALRALLVARPAVLVDVLPAPRRPAGMGDDVLWLPPVRHSLPGSVWLPNTGFGTLPVEEERYLRHNLAQLTGGDRDAVLVFFCERDCWMSWNAARRAVEWGYGSVYWYPDGTDGWREYGHALERIEPVPRLAGQ